MPLLFFALILMAPSLPPSVHHLLKSSPFLSFGFFLPSLTLWPASRPFIPRLPPPPHKPNLPQKEPSPLLYQFNLAVCFPLEECMFVVYSPSERPLRASVKCIVVLDEDFVWAICLFHSVGWHHGSLCQARPNISPEMKWMCWLVVGL